MCEESKTSYSLDVQIESSLAKGRDSLSVLRIKPLVPCLKRSHRLRFGQSDTLIVCSASAGFSTGKSTYISAQWTVASISRIIKIAALLCCMLEFRLQVNSCFRVSAATPLFWAESGISSRRLMTKTLGYTDKIDCQGMHRTCGGSKPAYCCLQSRPKADIGFGPPRVRK